MDALSQMLAIKLSTEHFDRKFRLFLELYQYEEGKLEDQKSRGARLVNIFIIFSFGISQRA